MRSLALCGSDSRIPTSRSPNYREKSCLILLGYAYLYRTREAMKTSACQDIPARTMGNYWNDDAIYKAMSLVEQLGHREQVVEAEAFGFLPHVIALLVAAGGNDAVPVALFA